MDAIVFEAFILSLCLLLVVLIGVMIYFSTTQIVNAVNGFISNVQADFISAAGQIIIIANRIQLAIDQAKASIVAYTAQLQADFKAQLNQWEAEAELFAQRIRENWPCAAAYASNQMLNSMIQIGNQLSAQSGIILTALVDSAADLALLPFALIDAISLILGCSCVNC